MSEATEFDYSLAWREAAMPAFYALPVEVLDLLATVCEVAKDLPQDADRNMIWPEGVAGEALRAKFDDTDDLTLAKAARAVYFYGHWSSAISERTAGGTWKFANYANQVLRARLGLPKKSDCHGLQLTVHEGVLRAGVGDKWGWSWDEICFATRDNFAVAAKALRAIEEPGQSSPRRRWDDYQDKIKAKSLKLQAELAPKDPPWSYFFERDRFMVPEGTRRAREDAARSAEADAKTEPRRAALMQAVRAIRACFDDAKEAERAIERLFGAVNPWLSLGFKASVLSEALKRADESAAAVALIERYRTLAREAFSDEGGRKRIHLGLAEKALVEIAEGAASTRSKERMYLPAHVTWGKDAKFRDMADAVRLAHDHGLNLTAPGESFREAANRILGMVGAQQEPKPDRGDEEGGSA